MKLVVSIILGNLITGKFLRQWQSRYPFSVKMDDLNVLTVEYHGRLFEKNIDQADSILLETIENQKGSSGMEKVFQIGADLGELEREKIQRREMV